MIEAYAISVAAKLEDGVSPGLLRIIDNLTRANVLMLDFVANARNISKMGLSIGKNLEKAAAGATALGDSTASLTRASYVLDNMAASSADVARNLKAAAAAGRGVGSGGIGSPSSGSGGRDYDHTGRAASGAGIATMGVVSYGIYENAKLENILTRAVLTDGTPANLQQQAKQLYMQRIRDGAVKYGFAAHGLSDFATSYLSASRLLRGMSASDRMAIIDNIMPYAAQEAYLKNISLDESLSAFIGASHMAGAYSAKDIAHILPALISTSMATNASMQQIENAAGYAVPILRTSLGIDPAKVFTAIAIFQRAGIKNSKSGTWLADLFMNAVPGNFGAGLFKDTKQTRALKKLGLLRGHTLTYLDQDGKLDPIKMLSILETNLQKLSPTERATYLKQGFGAQGARAAAILSDPKVAATIPMLDEAAKKLENPTETAKQAQAGNAAAASRQVGQNAQLFVTNMTATFMGPVNAVMAAAAPASANAANFAENHPLLSLGLGAGGVFGTLLVGKSMWAVSKLLMKGAGSLIERLVVGAAEQMTGAKIAGAALEYLAAGSGLIATVGVAMAAAAGYLLGKGFNSAVDSAYHWKKDDADITQDSAARKAKRAAYDRRLRAFGGDALVNATRSYDFQQLDQVLAGINHANATKPVHVHVNIDGKEVAHHLVGPANHHGTTALNPSVSRPMPGTPALGY